MTELCNHPKCTLLVIDGVVGVHHILVAIDIRVDDPFIVV